MTFNIGDLFIGTPFGRVQHYSKDGVFVETLRTLASTESGGNYNVLGCHVDKNGYLYVCLPGTYVTGSASDLVALIERFSPSGASLGQFGDAPFDNWNTNGGYFAWDIAPAPDGTFYVLVFHTSDATAHIWKLDANGHQINDWTVAHDANGTSFNEQGHIEVSCDGTTVFYTMMGFAIFQFNVQTGTQLANFEQLAANSPYRYGAFKLLPGGGVVANLTDPASPASGPCHALALSSDRTTFWTDKINDDATGAPHLFKWQLLDGSAVTNISFPYGPINCMASYFDPCAASGFVWSGIVG